MNIYYDTDTKRILFYGHKASAEFWDAQWEYDRFKEHVQKRARANTRMASMTRRFLPKTEGISILEGGCGDGHVVLSLTNVGYDVYGIDTASETVCALNTHFPELPITQKDVRATGFTDEQFMGYWSIGVIEHFYDGYDTVLDEMARVIAPGGYAFVSFPHMSGFRRWKARKQKYLPLVNLKEGEAFYQYALNTKNVIVDMERRGFSLCMKRYNSRLKGLTDEISWGKSLLKRISGGGNKFWKILRKLSEYIIPSFFSHSVLLVMKKQDV